MVRELIRSIILIDLGEQEDYYIVADGTNTFPAKHSCVEFILKGVLCYCPFVGAVKKSDLKLPEMPLNYLEITNDEHLIGVIKEKLF